METEGIHLSEIGFKLKGFKIEPQTPEQALANIQKFKQDLGLTGSVKVDKKRLKEIIARAGSFSDEVIATRNSERS